MNIHFGRCYNHELNNYFSASFISLVVVNTSLLYYGTHLKSLWRTILNHTLMCMFLFSTLLLDSWTLPFGHKLNPQHATFCQALTNTRFQEFILVGIQMSTSKCTFFIEEGIINIGQSVLCYIYTISVTCSGHKHKRKKFV